MNSSQFAGPSEDFSQDFELCGGGMPHMKAGAGRLGLMVRELAVNGTEFCVEAHFLHLETLLRFAKIVPSSRYCCYCWHSIATSADLRKTRPGNLRNARFVFPEASIAIEEAHLLPVEGWDGKPSGLATLRLTRRHRKPLSVGEEKPSAAMIELCSRVARGVIGADLSEPVKTVTEWIDDGRAHHYLMLVPTELAGIIAAELSSELHLSTGVASLEFIGTAGQVEEIERSGRYSFDQFPANCWSFNHGDGKTPFALERAGFLAPIINIGLSQLEQAAECLDTLATQITRCNIARRYLSWRVEPNQVSPQRRGNYVLLSRQRAGFKLFAGFEQYGDSDPTARHFKIFADERMKGDGLTFKRVSHVR